MAKRKPGFEVVVATDGSREARAAVAHAATFPWPPETRVHGVVARPAPGLVAWSPELSKAIEDGLVAVASAARRVLARRWPDADVEIVDGPPVDAIVRFARRLRARAIVLGSRGEGPLRRLLIGSVSRGVVRHAPSASLVAKGRAQGAGRVVLGVDGSRHAERAAEFLTGLAVPPRARVTVVRVVEPVRSPTLGLLPGNVRRAIASEVASLNEQTQQAARRELASVVEKLEAAGWSAQPVTRVGAPLDELLAAVRAARADLLVVGASGTGAVERLLLGSVANGALTHSPVPVLIVR